MDKTTYRADIDGLRAIAVLSVIIFHFIGSALPNGYLGVDIFFVISGFLITGIIHKSCLTNSFSLKEFYIRRVRRLFPAFISVLFVSCAVAYLLFIPSELLPFAKSALASLGFSSNILFYSEVGYFDAHSQLKPLLHTWSLAVEEQFYIIFPLLLIALHKWLKKYVACAIALLLVASLTAYLVTAFQAHDLDLAFYMLPMRAWELLIGAYLAIKAKQPSTTTPSANKIQATSILGLSLILMSLILPEEITKQPLNIMGIQTNPNEPKVLLNTIVTIGTALLLYAGSSPCPKTLVYRTLSLPPSIFIGKISYSLYLWHWPLYVFASYYFLDDLPKIAKALLILLSILFAYLSWRFIEQPVRQSHKKLRDMPAIKLGVITATIITLGSIVVIKNEGFTRYHQAMGLNNKPLTIGIQSPQKALNQGGHSLGTVLGTNGDIHNTSFILLGDSHADAISPALDAAAKDADKSGIFMLNTCLMTSESAQQFAAPKVKNCGESTDNFLRFLDDHKNIKTVFIAQRWRERTIEWQEAYSIQNPFALRQTSLLQLIQEIEDKAVKVIILEQIPALKIERNDAISIYWRLKLRNRNTEQAINPTRDIYTTKLEPIKTIFREIQHNTNAEFISALGTLCPEDKNTCKISDKNGLWYYDDDHLSTYGALKLAPLFSQAFSIEQRASSP